MNWIRRRWCRAVGALAVVALFGLWVGYRARQSDFSFLAGRRPLIAEYEVPDNFHPLQRDPEPFLETVFAFKADPNSITRQADSQLLGAGWKKDYWPDWGDHGNDCITYQEPGGQKRLVLIEPNVSVPFCSFTTDIVSGGIPQKGWVGITVSRPKLLELDRWSRSQMWLRKVFAGAP